jgi:pimeloyl-ACP methyl ester carboxylesterase
MKRWLVRLSAAVPLLISLAVLVGAGYESLARRQVARRFPISGRYVDIGGRRIQLDCRGVGSPIVVFESGLDLNGSLSWYRVQDAVAESTRACSYSRAGFLWSDSSNDSRNGKNIAMDLHVTLQKAGEKPPLILVGQSIGALYAVTYTKYFGSEVAGLVFVDPSHPQQRLRIRAITPVDPTALSLPERLGSSLEWTGIIRINWRIPVTGPRELQTIAAYGPTSFAAAVREKEHDAETFADAATGHRLGDRPLVVLTAMRPLSDDFLQALQLTPEQGERFQALWKAMHDEEASWSSVSEHRLIPDSNHSIQLERPDAVIAAVDWVLRSVRATANASGSFPEGDVRNVDDQ